MATRVYITSNEVGTTFDVPAAVTGATWDAGWEGTMAGGTVYHLEGWANITDAPTRPNTPDVDFQVKSGSNTSNQERYGFRVYIPVKAGTLISASQACSAGVMGGHDASWGFHWGLCCIRIINESGAISKELTDATINVGDLYMNNNSFPASSMSSRFKSGTTNTGNYTTVAGDWLVGEFGAHYETSGSLNMYLAGGDDNANDITSTDSTTRRNGFFEITTTLEWEPQGGVSALMLMGVGI